MPARRPARSLARGRWCLADRQRATGRRAGEIAATDLGLHTWRREPSDRARWITALAEHPSLIQQPTITADDSTTVVARTDAAIHSVPSPAPESDQA
jgi:hypothetical protein